MTTNPGDRPIHPVLGAVNVTADDPHALATFWAQVLGAAAPTSSGEFVFLPAREPDGFPLSFQLRGDARPLGQHLHLDLTVPWGTRESEVRRVVELGAEHRWDVLDEFPWVRWSTLADPEGNLFCIAEHPPS